MPYEIAVEMVGFVYVTLSTNIPKMPRLLLLDVPCSRAPGSYMTPSSNLEALRSHLQLLTL